MWCRSGTLKGEKIWVNDTQRDALSAIAQWRLPAGRREGYCRTRLGYNRWGVCNKSMTEGARFHWWSARYDRDTNKF